MLQRQRAERYQGSPWPQGCSHSETLTWGALEAVSIVTWPALAGEGSLGVEAHGVLVATARPAFIRVFKSRHETETTQEETVTLGVDEW